nr:immunoglobulin light chain junction region [Macaca mulatta]MPN86857.1 immunoglobulin light chain junction region [Macaca mulatta]MPN88426.1 immunoglobulin light chain junction region [Macaca mulatta]
CMQGIQCPLTF